LSALSHGPPRKLKTTPPLDGQLRPATSWPVTLEAGLRRQRLISVRHNQKSTMSTTAAKTWSHNQLETTRADPHGFIYIHRRRRRVVSKNLNFFLSGASPGAGRQPVVSCIVSVAVQGRQPLRCRRKETEVQRLARQLA
jgi:hypothetical protein